MTQKTKKLTALAVLCSILAVAFISLASAASTDATLTVTPVSNSSVISVTGSGFNASETVNLSLMNGTTFVYNFTESISTNSLGNFSANVTLPAGIYGTFNLTANTSTVSAYTAYTITQQSTTLTVTPDDSNIIQISGSGFNASDAVTLKLIDDAEATAYTFTNATTDAQGNFTTTAIIPTSLSGTYTLVTSTTSVTANATITVPDLTGPTGSPGENGVAGEVGATGTAGASADNTIGITAIVLSFIAIVVAAIAIVKKH